MGKNGKIDIGISLYIKKDGDSIFSNGIKQNVLMFYKLLKQSDKLTRFILLM